MVYRHLCSFKFSLKSFPEEFDFDLIKQNGWYKARNRGNNLKGVSRDHMISVTYGYENKIPPDIISHPANCQLIKQTENSSKGKHNSITLEQLYERIETWNKKYGTRAELMHI